MVGDPSSILALDHSLREQRVRALLIAFFVSILACLAYLIYFCFVAEIPVGAVGQPRGKGLSADWHVPVGLGLFYAALLLSLVATPFHPIVGVAAYLLVDGLFPIHKPMWIYTQWIGIRTLIAIFAASGCVLFLYRNRRLRWPWSDFISKLLLAFVGWYALCTAVAWIGNAEYDPVLQFHPLHLVDAFLIYTIVLTLPDKQRVLVFIAGTMCATLLIRFLFLQKGFDRDADIATNAAMTVATAVFTSMLFTGTTTRRWWLGIPWMIVAFVAAWLVYAVENRVHRGSLGARIVGILDHIEAPRGIPGIRHSRCHCRSVLHS